MLTALLLSLAALLPDPPTVNLTADHTKIAQSCIVHIAPGTVIADADGAGVIEIDADNITVEFEQGSLLKGAATGTGSTQVPWDQLTGCAIRINNHKNITLKNLSIAAYKVGVHATTADGLKIENASIHDCYRQHLKSTPQKPKTSARLALAPRQRQPRVGDQLRASRHLRRRLRQRHRPRPSPSASLSERHHPRPRHPRQHLRKRLLLPSPAGAPGHVA